MFKEAANAVEPQPIDLAAEGYGELVWVYKRDGSLFSLKVVPDAEFGRTHKLKSQRHFWEGTEEQFRQQFERV